MKKIVALLFVTVLTTGLFTACTKKEEVKEETTTEATTEEVDVVTTASIVTDGAALVNALSAKGTWIACTLNDIVLTEDLVVEGDFKKDDVAARKIALYTQDDNRNITAQFNLTAPKLIVKSENTKIQGGTFIGDVYVEANGFQVGKEATVQGNIYFASQEYMDSFIQDETGKVTGTTSVQ